jgi:hypothetical protein
MLGEENILRLDKMKQDIKVTKNEILEQEKKKAEI